MKRMRQNTLLEWSWETVVEVHAAISTILIYSSILKEGRGGEGRGGGGGVEADKARQGKVNAF